MPSHLNIIARTNGVGLDQDVSLVREIAQAAGHQVTVSHCRDISPLSAFLPQKKRFDANIFMERVFPRWIRTAHTNILIPNQERFPERHLPRLRKIDHIFCKSKHALEVFGQHHSSCHFTSFTSRDLFRPELPRLPLGILHLAGRSTLKGTETILRLWEKHPEWPTLTLLQHKEIAPAQVPDNVHLITTYLDQEDLIKLINEHPIHLCPSLSEGWGHYIVEAMACQAMVITTAAPPMNELITADRGKLIKVTTSEPRHLGTNFYIDEADLESTLTALLSSSPSELDELGQNARQWFLHNDAELRHTLPEFISSLCS